MKVNHKNAAIFVNQLFEKNPLTERNADTYYYAFTDYLFHFVDENDGTVLDMKRNLKNILNKMKHAEDAFHKYICIVSLEIVAKKLKMKQFLIIVGQVKISICRELVKFLSEIIPRQKKDGYDQSKKEKDSGNFITYRNYSFRKDALASSMFVEIIESKFSNLYSEYYLEEIALYILSNTSQITNHFDLKTNYDYLFNTIDEVFQYSEEKLIGFAIILSILNELHLQVKLRSYKREFEEDKKRYLKDLRLRRKILQKIEKETMMKIKKKKEKEKKKEKLRKEPIKVEKIKSDDKKKKQSTMFCKKCSSLIFNVKTHRRVCRNDTNFAKE